MPEVLVGNAVDRLHRHGAPHRTAFAVSGEPPVSIVSATFGRDESARTLGEVGAVETTMCSPAR